MQPAGVSLYSYLRSNDSECPSAEQLLCATRTDYGIDHYSSHDGSKALDTLLPELLAYSTTKVDGSL